MNYYISDLHLGHFNIIGHSHRPFATVEEMDKVLIDNWNSVVTDKDDVYCLGDLMFRAKNPESYLKQLKGRIHLVRGNHDNYLKDKSLHRYFASIDDYLRIKDGDTTLILFHYPIAEWDGFFHDSVHLYGHIHNSVNDTKKVMDGIKNCYNVGADVLGFTPRTLKQIMEIHRNTR